jgi:ribonuclease HII
MHPERTARQRVAPPVPTLEFEQIFLDQGYALIAGLDEAGRGALAGPVSAGAVILPLDRRDLLTVLDGVRDSKLCSPSQRDDLYERIQETALAAGAGMASHQEIDTLGIAAAARLAMSRAVGMLTRQPEALLIDWVRLRDVNLPQQSLVKGDQRSLSIAAASIIAKVTRDRLMIALDAQHPGYGFAQHKGYATPGHQSALLSLGPCDLHRRSFDPIRTRLLDTE